ncbi:NFX1-type zinc finger-containing protein 1-like [Macrosteles quadrilineatus]|uniref:NFX1-type zinc finger-containing protein 1-like n=1 Tax=Macrosteles quadrilineatus TaxID=74068 RepID=UPI0023E2307D|nr:NFX1-type zinc finger-containing protein 1-like [Macrosteles quadrilineatus]
MATNQKSTALYEKTRKHARKGKSHPFTHSRKNTKLKEKKHKRELVKSELKLVLEDQDSCDFEQVNDLLFSSNKIDYEVLTSFMDLLSQTFIDESTKKLEVLQWVFQKNFLDSVLKLIQEKTKEMIKTDDGSDKCEQFFRNFLRLSALAIKHLPASNLNFLIPTLMYIKNILSRLEEKINITCHHFDFDEMVNLINEKAKIEELEREQVSSSDVKNMRNMSVLPTVEDLFQKPPELKKNIVEGAYTNVDHYLTVQFALLREDFVAPVREGVLEHLSRSSIAKKRKTQVVMCHGVKIWHATIDKGKFGHVVQLAGNIKWEIVTKFFIFGSLLLFTTDSFKSFFVGTVINVNDKTETVTVKLDINYFKVCNNIYADEFTMAVSKVFFDPYYQVLSALQSMPTDNFPMEKYIVDVSSESSPPAYINKLHLSNYTFFGNMSVNIMDQNWPEFTEVKFNPSQQEAFQAALTNEFVAIQGPPGTGKTFLGLQIVNALLDNVNSSSPILVVCYKNHALDQFLEGILNTTEKIVRIGGRSRNEKLKNFNLKVLRGSYGIDLHNEVLEELATSYFKKQYQLDGLSKHGILSVDNVLPYVPHELREELLSTSLEDWLMEGAFLNEETEDTRYEELLDTADKINDNNEDSEQLNACSEQDNCPVSNSENIFQQEKFYFAEESKQRYVETYIDDYSEVYDNIAGKAQKEVIENMGEWEDRGKVSVLKPYFTLTIRFLKEYRDILEFQAMELQKNGEECIDLDREKEDLTKEIGFLKRMLNMKKFNKPKELQEICLIAEQKGMWALSNRQRWLLYHSWLHRLAEDMRGELMRLEKSIRSAEEMIDVARSGADLKILEKAKVVGVTTSGAASNRATLNKLGAKIVIIEEAAEVLESHIVTSLSSSCQHLILIGDHKQLKPNPAVFQLCKKYNFDVSLFERMVRNGMNCYSLNVQHRMRPEFASLIVPTIYPELVSHSSTKKRPDIRGIHSNLYFINHNNPEEQLLETQSHVNKHEAKFVLELARYLVLQGYLPNEITILATYSGQMKKIMKMRDQEMREVRDVRITTVDDFQGEENKIIILSLVRSNEEGKIGFLKTENRVCVALSRARDGLYIIGNMDCLAENSQIWPQVRDRLMEHNAIGESLSVYCENHRETKSLVKDGAMFQQMPQGGCSRKCEVNLGCGHKCKYHCHPRDQEHRGRYMCPAPCERTCKLQHPCRKPCGKDCGPCPFPVEFLLDCNHTRKAACGSDPAKIQCRENVPCILPCNHDSTKLCYQTDEEVRTIKCKSVCGQAIPCGHQCQKPCHYLERWCFYYKCEVIAEKTLDCGHKVEFKCCEKDKVMLDCHQITEKELRCGHLHTAPCSSFKYNITKCLELVEKKLICGHKVELKCCEKDKVILDCDQIIEKKLSCDHLHTAPCSSFTKNTTKCLVLVEKQLECNHTETLPCGQPIDEIICTKETSRKLLCGHSVIGQCGTPLDKLQCKKPCAKVLKCGHPCKKTCYKPCLCKTIVEKELECGHKVKTKCSVTPVCDQPCERVLLCGHKVKTTCSAVTPVCEQPCERVLLCGHKVKTKCSAKTPVCMQPCERELTCGHKCKDKCGAKCDVKKCKKLVLSKVKPDCGHDPMMVQCCFNHTDWLSLKLIQFCKAKCDALLKCGHHCRGECGNCKTKGAHQVCEKPCKVFGPCGHRCTKKCHEECGVCNKKCLKKCSHQKCDHVCGETCNICQEPCDRGCIHQKCSRPCFAVCNRKPCAFPCPSPLACGHPCQGFCGDPCPEICLLCEPQLASDIKPDHRIIVLDCGHSVDAATMDANIHMNKGRITRCPIVSCQTPVITTKRYHKEVTEAFFNIMKLKREITLKTIRKPSMKTCEETRQEDSHRHTNKPIGRSNQNECTSRNLYNDSTHSRREPNRPNQNASRNPYNKSTNSRGGPYRPNQNASRNPYNNSTNSREGPYRPNQNISTSRNPYNNPASSRGRPYQQIQNGAFSRNPFNSPTNPRGRPWQPGQYRDHPRNPYNNPESSRERPPQQIQNGATSRYPFNSPTNPRGRPRQPGQYRDHPRNPYNNPENSRERPYQQIQNGATSRNLFNSPTSRGRPRQPGQYRDPSINSYNNPRQGRYTYMVPTEAGQNGASARNSNTSTEKPQTLNKTETKTRLTKFQRPKDQITDTTRSAEE